MKKWCGGEGDHYIGSQIEARKINESRSIKNQLLADFVVVYTYRFVSFVSFVLFRLFCFVCFVCFVLYRLFRLFRLFCFVCFVSFVSFVLFCIVCFVCFVSFASFVSFCFYYFALRRIVSCRVVCLFVFNSVCFCACFSVAQ